MRGWGVSRGKKRSRSLTGAVRESQRGGGERAVGEQGGGRQMRPSRARERVFQGLNHSRLVFFDDGQLLVQEALVNCPRLLPPESSWVVVVRCGGAGSSWVRRVRCSVSPTKLCVSAGASFVRTELASCSQRTTSDWESTNWCMCRHPILRGCVKVNLLQGTWPVCPVMSPSTKQQQR